MSAATEPVVIDDAPESPGKGRKKLLAMTVAAGVVLAGAGGGATWLVKKRQAAAAAAAEASDAADGDGTAAPAPQREVRKTPPAFLPMENFIVNLADRDSERFAQIGITLELDDPKYADELKAYMPAIRNGVLMLIAHKTSQELLTRAGKEKLAMEILRESVRPMGMELEDDDGPRAGRTPLEQSPVRHVHFSSFIIQ